MASRSLFIALVALLSLSVACSKESPQSEALPSNSSTKGSVASKASTPNPGGIKARTPQASRFALRIVDRNNLWISQQEPILRSYIQDGGIAFQDGGIASSLRLVSFSAPHTHGPWMGPYFRAASQEELLNFVATLSKTAPRDRSIGVEYVEDQRPGKGDHFWRTVFVQEPPGITGEHVASASVVEEETGGWAVSVDLTPEGGRLFSEVTERNVQEYLAIMVDRRALSIPVILEKISGGRLRITMGAEKKPAETLRAAKELVSVLNAHSSN